MIVTDFVLFSNYLTKGLKVREKTQMGIIIVERSSFEESNTDQPHDAVFKYTAIVFSN